MMSKIILGIAVVFCFIALGTDAVKPVNDSYCPSSYPNVYLSGKWCCKYNKEKINKVEGTKCDGSKIGFDSTCCEKDNAVKCMYSSCKSYITEVQCVGSESWKTKEEKGCILLGKQKRKDNSNIVGVAFSTTYMGMCYCSPNDDDLKLSDYKLEIYKTCKFQFNLPSTTSFLKEFALRMNQLITTFDTFGKEYSVTFEVKVTKFLQRGFASVLHFTAKEDKSYYGDRTPFVLFWGNKINVCGAVDGYESYCGETSALPKGIWIPVKVVQFRSKSGYRWQFSVNNKMIKSKSNNRPEDFKNVKVYAGDPWYLPIPGFIRNLVIKGQCGACGME